MNCGNTQKDDSEYLVRNFGLEFIAVFHTIAINTLVQDYLNRLGPDAANVAKSMYAAWRQNVVAGCQERLKRASAEFSTNPQAPNPDHLNAIMGSAFSRAQADVLSVLKLSQTKQGTSPSTTS